MVVLAVLRQHATHKHMQLIGWLLVAVLVDSWIKTRINRRQHTALQYYEMHQNDHPPKGNTAQHCVAHYSHVVAMFVCTFRRPSVRPSVLLSFVEQLDEVVVLVQLYQSCFKDLLFCLFSDRSFQFFCAFFYFLNTKQRDLFWLNSLYRMVGGEWANINMIFETKPFCCLSLGLFGPHM